MINEIYQDLVSYLEFDSEIFMRLALGSIIATVFCIALNFFGGNRSTEIPFAATDLSEKGRRFLRAIDSGDVGRVQKLVQNIDSYELNTICDVWNNTPLHHAARCRSPEIVEILMTAGAGPQVSVQNIHRQTPLNLAIAPETHPSLTDDGQIDAIIEQHVMFELETQTSLALIKHMSPEALAKQTELLLSAQAVDKHLVTQAIQAKTSILSYLKFEKIPSVANEGAFTSSKKMVLKISCDAL